MVESPFQSPFDHWAALQMMADNITSREVSLMRSAWQEAVKQERELCAKLCEETLAEGDYFKDYEDNHEDGYIDGCNNCAAAIRARSSMESKNG